jgi:hypothetical protein
MNTSTEQPNPAIYEIPKSALLAFITSVPFDAISIPQQYTTDRPEDFVGFIDAITLSLNKVLHESAPTMTSPKKVLSSWTVHEDPSSPPTYTTPTSSLSNILRPSNRPPTTTPKARSWNVSAEHDEDSCTQDLFGQHSLSSNERRNILQQKSLAGTPLYRSRSLTQAEERAKHPSITHKDRRPDITGYEPSSMSCERKLQMRPFMEKMKETIEWNPFVSVIPDTITLGRDRAGYETSDKPIKSRLAASGST